MARPTPAWRRYLRFSGPDIASDVDEELRFHFEERIEELLAGGLSREDANARALAEFGDVAATRTQLERIDHRILRRRTVLERLLVLRDEVRLALRRLVRQPAFTVPAVLTLGLGLASVAVAFTLLQSILLRPLAYPEAGQLVSLASPMPKLGDVWGIARHQLPYYKEHVRAFEDMALFRGRQVTTAGDGVFPAERLVAASVSASIFPTLRIGPELGRVLRPDDNLPRVGTVVVLSHDYWMRRFGGDPGVIGTLLTIDGTAREIVGVTPRGASLPDRPVELWMPDYIDPAAPPINNHVRSAVARLRPGFTASDAEAQIAPLVVRMDELFPSAYPNHWIRESGFRTSVTPLRDEVVGATVARFLWILFAAVWLVLGIAIANAANLVMVRAEGQRREIVMRTALGASRPIMLLHFVTEGLVVTMLAALVACGLAAVVLGVFPALAADTLPRLSEVHFGLGTVGLIVAVALLTGVGLGLIPLTHAKPDSEALREGSRTLTASRTRMALRHLLVVGQVALTVVLLVGAGLLIRSGLRLRAVDDGFEARGVVTLDVALSPAAYRSYDAAATVYRQLAERVGAMPGVQSVGFAEALPLSGEQGCTSVVAAAVGDGPRRERCVATMHTSPGYFETMGIEVRGRTPDWADAVRHVGGVVVSPALARRLWPDQDPIGQSMRCCRGGDHWDRVVGVTGEVHLTSLDAPPDEVAYFAIVPPDSAPTNNWPLDVRMVVRAPTLTAAAIQSMAREAMAEIDATIPVSQARLMTDVAADSMARRTFTLILIVVAALMALLLSAVGLYGVIAFVVGQREREIGVRMAVGASAGQIGALVLGQSLRLVTAGVVIGLGGALAGTRVLASLLFEVSPTDPLVLALVALGVAILGLVASGVPTVRAVRVDPVTALRGD
ncbi:MAG TPA: ABC transporter permease [Gemmatimonadales bacterium]|nr:ABC transporter permease [Gemmatimonadales bacterium]